LWLAKVWPLLLVLSVSLAVRIYVYAVMHPGLHTDSITFFFLTELDMVRTPGYPLFIESLLSFNDIFSLTSDYFRMICFGQIFILGMLNVYLIYAITRFLTGGRIFALSMGVFYNFNYFILGFEFQLLTETLSTTLLLAAVLIYLRLFRTKKSAAVAAGILMVLLIYTRPTFLLLGFFFPLLTFIGFFPFSKKRKFWKMLAPAMILFLLINALGIGAWSMRNQIKFDYFGVSSLMPFQLRYYTNRLFAKYQPSGAAQVDRVAAIYAEEFEKKGHSSETVYNFHTRVNSEMGLTDAEISKLFGKANLNLIKDYPMEYLKQVPASVLSYYRQYSTYWTSGNNRKFIHSQAVMPALFRGFFLLYKQLFENPYLLFLLMILAPAFLLVSVRKNKRIFHGWFIIFSVIHYNCFVSTLSTIAGINNLRYRAPVEPLILLMFYAAFYYAGRMVFKRSKKTFLEKMQ